MTHYLSGGGGGPVNSPSSSPGRPCRLVGRANDRGKDSRNQCITDFFKPAVKQEKINRKGGLLLTNTEHLRRNVSSPKQNRRRKFPPPPPNRSPIIEAFLRGAKSEKKDSPDNAVCISPKAVQSNVVRKLFVLDGSSDQFLILTDNTSTKNIERNEKCSIQTRSPLVENGRECKMDYVDVELTGSDLNKCASTAEDDGSLKKDSITSWYQPTACSEMLESGSNSSSSWLSLETVCRKRQKKKKMPSNQQSFDVSVKESLGSSFPNQDRREILKERSCLTSQVASSDDSSPAQVSKAAFSSRGTSAKIANRGKVQSYPSVYTSSTTSSRISKQKEFPEKRKRVSLKTNVKNSEKPIRQKLNKNSFAGSLEKHKSNCSSHRICPDDALDKDINSDLPILAVCLDKQDRKTDKNDQIQTADAKDAHKNYTLLTLYGSSLKEAEQTGNNTSFLPSKNIDQPVSSLEDKLDSEGSGLKTCTQRRKRSVSDSEEEISDCSLDDSDEELFLPLEKILAQSSTSSGKSSREVKDGDNSVDTVVPDSRPSVETQVSYMSQMEHILKEQEEFSRICELEQQLQEFNWEPEINSLHEEQSNDGELCAEHKAFLEKYSVIVDGIPDQHPGENIFQIIHAGKIFNQYNLDLRNSGFHPQNPIEKHLMRSEITQQLFVITGDLLMLAYHTSPCPVPILKWMFQMMTVHPDFLVSRKILNTLMTVTVENATNGSDEPRPWIPSLFDIAAVLINLGVPFSALFPLPNFQPSFTEDDIRSEMSETVRQQSRRDIFGDSVPFFVIIDTILCNMTKFLRLCISICGEVYTQNEIFLLLFLLFKLSLERELKQFPLVYMQCLILKLLENIGQWDTKMMELCQAISCLSNHHHDLLWLVQFVPNWTARGKQVRRHLSFVIISKLLENHVDIPRNLDQQMSLLCKELVMMKPSNLLKKHLEKVDDGSDLSEEPFISELEPKVYYLDYVLLHLVREASNSESRSLSQKKWLLKLCNILEKHIKCDIREDARLFYKTKVKDLVARIYSKWQELINSSQLTQRMIHDFVVLDA